MDRRILPAQKKHFLVMCGISAVPRQHAYSRGGGGAAEVKSVPLSVIVYSEILFMDDERPSSLSSYSRRVLAQYWLLKEKFLGSESGCAAAAPR